MQHLIGYRMFAALDSRATDKEERSREAALRLEFIRLVPAAGRLRTTELVLKRHHTQLGCRLEYHLALSPQTSFDFNGSGDPSLAGTGVVENFEADVASVSADCASVKTRLVLAHSPTLSPKQLAQNTTAMLDTKALRSLFRRRKRQIFLPTPNGDLPFDLPAVPKHLPTANRGELIAQVTRLSPGCTALLRRLTWKSRPVITADQLPPLPNSISACRRALSRDDCLRLLKGMDEATELALQAEVAFDWATGSVASLKLLSVAID
jgi:hypothetical protein